MNSASIYTDGNWRPTTAGVQGLGGWRRSQLLSVK